MARPPSISATLVPESQRLQTVQDLFGTQFPMRWEPFFYATTSQIAKEYTGGSWDFFKLSNSGFYMAPDSCEVFRVYA